ncbi:MAG: 2,3-bisphosphoglycerate-independent phosphoglycerate mutase [Hyphomicrobiales bacterium]|nr:2,3-bisphosphoglycerate-independent phosphoglycerate mutase [Hyphomicrobiales bacterium]
MSEIRSGKGPRPVVLCILDGWGDRSDTTDNAIALANTPNWDRMVSSYPRARLDASAHEVGLPEGQMGNSEVGHMNLGAGRVVMQDLPRIDAAIEDGSIYDSAELGRFVEALRQSGGACHLMGLMSPGGVHSMQDHMAAIARHVTGAGVPVVVHSFLDGRDTPPSSGAGYMARFVADVAGLPNLSYGVVSGRYYAMDRDKRWDRVQKAYAALVDAQGEAAPDPVAAVRAGYDAGTTDEFVLPTIVGGYAGMQDGDGLFMANFRADRAREILSALADPAFDGFERGRVVDFAARMGMVEFSTDLNRFYEVLFPPLTLSHILGSVVAEAGLKQLRIAETEKYAHVTFFFNGGEEQVFPGEERILVPSPKVATYDLQPAMSAPEVTDKLVAAIESGAFDVIIANYANGDMVGHTGILAAAMEAAETVDQSLGRLEAAVKKMGGTMLVTADHGNAELMRDPETGEPHTAHTLNKVPAILVNHPAGAVTLHDGRLADVAPTLLDLLGLPQPVEMTGRSLIDAGTAQTAAAE